MTDKVHCKAAKQKMAKLRLASGHVQTDDKMEGTRQDAWSFPQEKFTAF